VEALGVRTNLLAQQSGEILDKSDELLDKSDKIIELMTLQESRQYRVPCGELTVMGEIGHGSTKLVSKAKWGSRNVAVAAGAMKEEASIMASMSNHRNILRFYGTSVFPDGKSYIVTELARHGSLKEFIEDLEGKGEELSLLVKLDVLRQISDGLAEIHAHNIIHRDVSLRNVLVKQVTRNGNNEIESMWVVVSDLGLSKSTDQMNAAYYGAGIDGLPYQWMAPESFEKGRFSNASDVYSFGVLIWELLTNGGIPWTIGATYEIVSNKVMAGERLVLPYGTRSDLAELYNKCCHQLPNTRPSFETISSKLTEIKVCSTLSHTNLLPIPFVFSIYVQKRIYALIVSLFVCDFFFFDSITSN
jgi:serine/threonine protein kinase